MTREEIISTLIKVNEAPLERKIDSFIDAGGDIETLSSLLSPSFVAAEAQGDGGPVPYPTMTPAKTLELLNGSGLTLADALLAYPDLSSRLGQSSPIWGVLDDVFKARTNFGETDNGLLEIAAEEAPTGTEMADVDMSAAPVDPTELTLDVSEESENELLPELRDGTPMREPSDDDNISAADEPDAASDDATNGISTDVRAAGESEVPGIHAGASDDGEAAGRTEMEHGTDPTSPPELEFAREEVEQVDDNIATLLTQLRKKLPHGLKVVKHDG
jgi:hypothetical protein